MSCAQHPLSDSYKRKLPLTSMIHHVIHVSQLKKYIAKNIKVFTELHVEPPTLQVPKKIIRKCIDGKLYQEGGIASFDWIIVCLLWLHGRMSRIYFYDSRTHQLRDKPTLKNEGMSLTLPIDMVIAHVGGRKSRRCRRGPKRRGPSYDSQCLLEKCRTVRFSGPEWMAWSSPPPSTEATYLNDFASWRKRLLEATRVWRCI
jgi:hypothetical protein